MGRLRPDHEDRPHEFAAQYKSIREAANLRSEYTVPEAPWELQQVV